MLKNIKKYLVFMSFSWLFFLLPLPSLAATQNISIACASNFYGTLKVLIDAYHKEGHDVNFTVMQGSSGKLVTQIMNGMPVDIFLAGDQAAAQYLTQQKKTDKLFTYAIGQVILLVNDNKPSTYTSAEEYLKKATITHIGLASPKLAPYGAQAEILLQEMHLWQSLAAKMVYGDDVGQVFHYVITHNVDAGFVALSQVKQYQAAHSPFERYHVYYFDSSLRTLKQGGVVLKGAKNSRAALDFIEYLLTSTQAKHILMQMGYQPAFE